MNTRGRAFLLKTSDGGEPPVFRTVAGLRVTSETISEARYSASASGIFLGCAAENQIRANAMAGTLDDYELRFEDGSKLRGKFLIQKLDYDGYFNGEHNYAMHLESSGAVVLA